MSGVTNVAGVALIAVAITLGLVLAADLADATNDYREACPELERNTGECRVLAQEVIVNDGYELSILGLFPPLAIGGVLVLYGGREADLAPA